MCVPVKFWMSYEETFIKEIKLALKKAFDSLTDMTVSYDLVTCIFDF